MRPDEIPPPMDTAGGTIRLFAVLMLLIFGGSAALVCWALWHLWHFVRHLFGV